MQAQALEAIPLPALIIAEDDGMLLANSAFKSLFPMIEFGRTYLSLLRHPALDKLVSDTRAGQKGGSAELHVRIGIEQVFRATCALLPDRSLLLCLQDTSETAAAVQTRRDFIADLSHELRTPLTSIRGILDTTDGDPEGLAQFTPILGQEVDRMTRLVTDLIALNRVQSNVRRRPTGPVCLQDVVDAATAPLQAMAQQLGARITTDMPTQDIIVPGDRDELIQAVTNLSENALRYGHARPPAESIVTITLERSGAQAVLSVRDNGQGVALHHMPRLTERFYRVDHHRSREVGGSGLGLAIVKHVANHHRAQLGFYPAEGGGLEVRLTLPDAAQST